MLSRCSHRGALKEHNFEKKFLFSNKDHNKLKSPTADEAQHLKPRAETCLVKGFRNLTEQHYKVSAAFN